MKSATRKPLQPKNTHTISKPKELPCKPSLFPPSHNDKENLPLPSVDASLADELCAFRQKLERLRLDRERTEETLKERDLALDSQFEMLLRRGQIQMMLEIQVDRLFRLKELHSSSTKISSIRSLREKEQEKRNGASVPMSPVPMPDDMEESEGENTIQSPSSTQSQEMTPGGKN